MPSDEYNELVTTMSHSDACRQLQIDDKVLDKAVLLCAVGRTEQGIAWRARGFYVEAFVASYANPFVRISDDGWLYAGPFKTKRDAVHDLGGFQDAYCKFCNRRGVVITLAYESNRERFDA
jgi:hypothetical protein